MLEEFLYLLGLLLLSGFFSGTETALTTITMARVETLVADGRRGSHALLRLKSQMHHTLIAILIGNNLVNVAASALATVLATELFDHWGPGIAVGVLTMAILVIGEVTPKSLAMRYAVPIALFVATPLALFGRVVAPIVWLLERFTAQMSNLSPAEDDPMVTEQELIRLAGHGAREGTIQDDEKEIIERVFAFDHLKAGDVMTPRHRVVSIDGRRTVHEALSDLLATRHSRFPLHSGDPDLVTGMIHLREVLDAFAHQDRERTLSELGEMPMFVPINHRIDDLFEVLRTRERHLIVVVNEFGVLQGLLTLEDLLEELVGEIYDDRDPPREMIEQREGSIVADGTVEVRELEGLLEMDLSGKPTDSISLWILRS